MRFSILLFHLLLVPVAAVPAERSVDRPEIVVFCAAGAADVVDQLCREYEAEHAVKVRLNFASSSTLARQIEAGAKADVFISAHKQWMGYLQDRALVAPGERRDWATNRLVLVAAKQTPSAGDTRRADLRAALAEIDGKIAIGDPDHVPAGIYARQALESAGLYESLKGRVVACPSVRAALRLVEEGQVEAGIVYQSDAVASERVALIGVFPQSWHEPITFQLALLRDHCSAAEALARFLSGARAAWTLAQYGFDDLGRDFAGRGTPRAPHGPFWRLTEAERSALWMSLKVALVSVLLLIGPGIFLGYVLARKRFAGKTIVEGLVHAPLVLPPIVTGYLLLLVLGNNGVVGRWLRLALGVEFAFTFKAAALASALVALPLMVRSVRVAAAVADRGLEAAAYTLGAGRVRTFLLVSLPLAAPGIIAGMVLAFARSLGEFGATAVFMGNVEGQRTLPLAVYAALQTAHGEETAWKLVVISIVVSVAAVAASELLARRAGGYLERSHVA